MSKSRFFRHPGILPSVASNLISHVFQADGREFSVNDLLAWSDPIPRESVAEEIRAQFVVRIRNAAERLWVLPACISLEPGWHDVVHGDDKERLLAFVASLTSPQDFVKLTMREIKEGFKLPLLRVLRILARLESIYWVPGPRAMRVEELVAWDPQQRVEVSAQKRQQLLELAKQPWVQALAWDDIRFPSIDERGMGAWLVEQSGKKELSLRQLDLCDRMLMAGKSNWGTELQEVARAGLALAERQPGSLEKASLWTQAFMLRYGGLEGKTLQEVGDLVSLTRERVRQITERCFDVIHASSAAMPALDRVLSASSRIAPSSLPECNIQLADFLGEGQGIKAAIDFALALGRSPGVQVAKHRISTSSGYELIPCVVKATEPSGWLQVALSIARQEILTVGCTNFVRVAGLVAEQTGEVKDMEALRQVLQEAPGFERIGGTDGWFTLVDGESSALAARIRKLMSVATSTVNIDVIVTMLVTDDQWLYRDVEKSRAVPPSHVLAGLLKRWDWLESDKHNKFRSRTVIDQKSVLSDTELAVVRVIENHGGVATRADIAKVLITEQGVSNPTVSICLASSPTVIKIEHSIYATNGRELNALALIEARKRYALEGPRGARLVRADVDLTKPFTVQVTHCNTPKESRHRIVYLPRFFLPSATGVFDHAGRAHGRISISSTGQISRIAAVADAIGVGPGERFELELDLTNRTYSVNAKQHSLVISDRIAALSS